jgi:hypothetical protein
VLLFVVVAFFGMMKFVGKLLLLEVLLEDKLLLGKLLVLVRVLVEVLVNELLATRLVGPKMGLLLLFDVLFGLFVLKGLLEVLLQLKELLLLILLLLLLLLLQNGLLLLLIFLFRIL